MQEFGADYFRVAYAFAAEPQKIFDIDKWPGLEDMLKLMVPSLLTYNSQGSFQWGHEVSNKYPDQVLAIRIPQSLDLGRSLCVEGSETYAMSQETRSHIIAVTADYLEAVYKHTLNCIDGNVLFDFSSFRKKVTCSIPLACSDDSKSAISRVSSAAPYTFGCLLNDSDHQAFRVAGIDCRSLIDESKAAAMYGLWSLDRKGISV